MAVYIWSLYFLIIFISFYFLFKKAGMASWKAFIPGYNIYAAIELTGRPWWWILLFIIPGVNLFMFWILIIQIIKSFGKYDFWNLTLGMLLAPFYLLYLGTSKEFKFAGPSGDENYRKIRKKSKHRGKEFICN